MRLCGFPCCVNTAVIRYKVITLSFINQIISNSFYYTIQYVTTDVFGTMDMLH